MLPTKSNTAGQGCIPVSSDCVLWQGPNIPCLNLCNGDTVSTVVYKVAEKLCLIKDELNLSNLDLSCLLTFCSSVGPAPTTKTLSAVLDFIIKKICCIADNVNGLPGGNIPEGGYTEPTLSLPVCLQYTNPANGQTVTQLVHNQFTLRLATQYCTLSATVASHTNTLASHNTRITALENAPGVVLPQVTPNCILPAVPTAMATVLDKLEEEYCLLRAVLGSNTQLTAAVAQQCAGLGSSNALSQAGTMSGITGWNNSVTNAAQAFQNLWIIVCDMRAAVNDLKTTTGSVDCSQFILNYDASASANRQEVYLDFNPGTIIPNGATSAPTQPTNITISDGTTSKQFTINIVTEAGNSTPYTAIVAGSGVTGSALNTSLPYTVTVNATVAKSGTNCNKTVQKTISVPCPVITGVTATLV